MNEGSGLEVVSMREMAFIVLVSNDGTVSIQGQADPSYIVEALRALADDMEENGWGEQ